MTGHRRESGKENDDETTDDNVSHPERSGYPIQRPSTCQPEVGTGRWMLRDLERLPGPRWNALLTKSDPL